MKTTEIEDSTRSGYVNYIERYIRPALGKVPVRKPSIEKHKEDGEHDCVEKKCKPHECNPLGASTVRQIHSIISGTLSAAKRWNWIDNNPADLARRPKAKPPEPDPPSPAEAAKLVEEAFRMDEDDDDWGTLVWLAMTTGMRRGELCALRFSSLHLDGETIDISRNWDNGSSPQGTPKAREGASRSTRPDLL